MTPREEWHLETHRLGRRVLVYDVLDSTNTQAAALANDPSNDGVVILADRQTAGRGQHGRTWLCTPGTGVLMSVLLFPPPAVRRPALLTAWAAVSVCETIQHLCGLEARIKWPNDVLIEGRKVCGILIEQGQGTVVGVGLNVRQSPTELADLPAAGSLAFFIKTHLDVATVARALIGQLDAIYDSLCNGNLTVLARQWQERLGLVGEAVVAECHDAVFRGTVRSLSWQALEIDLTDGQRLRLMPEQIRHLTLVGKGLTK